jgi:hypothetical protein
MHAVRCRNVCALRNLVTLSAVNKAPAKLAFLLSGIASVGLGRMNSTEANGPVTTKPRSLPKNWDCQTTLSRASGSGESSVESQYGRPITSGCSLRRADSNLNQSRRLQILVKVWSGQHDLEITATLKETSRRAENQSGSQNTVPTIVLCFVLSDQSRKQSIPMFCV